ncbi:NADH-ubiquinone oxidoreductase-F iron-sulfur binding region domain-containing protein [Chloroflexota bacterium]
MKQAAKQNVAEAFLQLREGATQRWQELRLGQRPYVLVGTATCGRAAGAAEVAEAFRGQIAQRGLNVPVIEVGCMGHCYAEPIVIIGKPEQAPVAYARVNDVIVERIVKEYILGDNPCLEFVLAALEPNEMIPAFADFPRASYENKIILNNSGEIDPEQIDDYLARGGYAGLAKALEMKPKAIIDEMIESGLRGRGGAGFGTGAKWQMCHDAPGDVKYLICNADEGDPGAFMDRAILESDPHAVLEGMIIAGRAVGARQGIIYVRAEYPLAVKRLERALVQAQAAGLLAPDILGSGFGFEISVFEGSGAFVCGEESALIASIEGGAGLPRLRPPYPASSGLFGQPTVVNNVKTLAYVRHIIEHEAGWFNGIGTEKSPGTAVFALAGKVVNTGLVEVPMGTTLRQVIFDVGSGIHGGKKFKAVQIGGPSGGCLSESALDLPIDFDSLREAGAMMGSGGMIVLDEDDCMVEIARYFMEFIQGESCGKCTFCRIGTRQMLDSLTRITMGEGELTDLDILEALAGDVAAGSLCALGKTSPNPVLTTLRYFRDEYRAHIEWGKCPALMCQHLIAYYILPEKCERSCDACIGSCTVDAIYPNEKRIKVIDQSLCVKCDTCLKACPKQYNAIVKISPAGEVPFDGVRAK